MTTFLIVYGVFVFLSLMVTIYLSISEYKLKSGDYSFWVWMSLFSPIVPLMIVTMLIFCAVIIVNGKIERESMQ